MAIKLDFEPLDPLFESSPGDTSQLFKTMVFEDIKLTRLGGVLSTQIQVDFAPKDGSDILIRKLDPENALGYSVYADLSDYYQHLSASLYQPSDEEILGALDG